MTTPPRLSLTDDERARLDRAALTGVPPNLVPAAWVDTELRPHLPVGEDARRVTRLHVIIRGRGHFPFDRYANLESVLIVNARDEHLATVAQLPRLRMLHLAAARVASLEALAGAPALEHLVLDDANALVAPAEIETLASLRTLSLLGAARLTHLAPLGAAARSIREIVMRKSGPGSKMHLESLAPLAAARELRYADLRVPVDDASLAPLCGLSTLEYLEILPKKFPVTEVEALRRALPGIRGALAG